MNILLEAILDEVQDALAITAYIMLLVGISFFEVWCRHNDCDKYLDW